MFIPERGRPQDQINVGVTLSVNTPGLKDSDVDTSKGKKKEGHASGIQSLWVKTDGAHVREIDSETLEPIMGSCHTNCPPSRTYRPPFRRSRQVRPGHWRLILN